MSWKRNRWAEGLSQNSHNSPHGHMGLASRKMIGIYGLIGVCLLVGLILLITKNLHSSTPVQQVPVTKKMNHKKTPIRLSSIHSAGETNISQVIPSQPVTESILRGKTPEEVENEARAKDPLYDRHHIVAAKPLVADAVDQLIVTIFSTDLGDMPPFLPPLSNLDEERTIKAIDKLEKAAEDDTPEAREAKELVNAVKKGLKKFLDEGGTVNGFLSHYANELQSAFEERQTCRELVSKSIRSESPQAARELYEKYNEHLSNKGIKPLSLNRRQKEYLGIKEDEQ